MTRARPNRQTRAQRGEQMARFLASTTLPVEEVTRILRVVYGLPEREATYEAMRADTRRRQG